ncbi:formate dehydrogenase [Geothrix limicola]|uniref:Formate dehydrogenase n=1 Tax=Geothrix limicola TaxID=2927978 RepID=A0ABQ5QI29_9BACT|nr:molybdopterin oxidoreductase family protein [Geothrix limicola]GLH73976.1 formate dehydrogenase [Geothrix limicola]
MATTTHRSVCPYDCPDACGLVVQVEDGRAVDVSGDPEHPFTRGMLCPKMNRYQDTVHHPERLTTPLLRVGPKGAGAFAPIPWGEAIDRIADRWRGIISEHGAEAILPYSYAGTMGLVQRTAGHAFFHRMGASRLDRTICSPAKSAGWSLVMGSTPAPHPDACRHSDLILIWGQNAAATNVHGLHAVREAKRQGAKVWLIDTYIHATAPLCDRVVTVKPGSDSALALGLLHLLDAMGLADEAFLARHVVGHEELRARILPDYPPERVAALTGVPEATLRELAEAYGRARDPHIRTGNGLSRYGNGAMTLRTIACLPAFVGAYAKPGGGAFTSTGTSAVFPMEVLTREDLQPGPTRIINMNRLGWALHELDAPKVASLYVYNANPAAVTPDQNAVLAGLAREDLFTVVHERFMTDTAQFADLVLPATSSLEHSDLYRSYGSYCVQRVQAAVPPVGEARSNLDVFQGLARAMGFTEEVFSQSADQLIDALLATPHPWREGISAERFEQGLAVELNPGIGTDSGSEPRFGTPSGRIEILNPRDAEPLPRYLPPHSASDPHPLQLITAPALQGLNSTFHEREELRRRMGVMAVQLNPEEAKARGLRDGDPVTVFNERGEVAFHLKVTDKVPVGVTVAEGVWWRRYAPGDRTVNALTSQRLTDRGGGSTFYDNRVDVRAAS